MKEDFLKGRVLLFANPDSIHTDKWKEGWRLIGYDVKVSGISSERKYRKYVMEGDISSVGGNGLIYLKNILNFKNILKTIDPVILNPHFLTSYGLISALIKRKKDFMIMSIHGTDIMRNMNKNFIYLWMAKYIFLKSDLIISVSDLMTKKIIQYSPYLKDKIVTQQYGINIDLLNLFYSKRKNIFISTNRQWKPNSNYPVILKSLNNFMNKNIKVIGYDNSQYAKEILSEFVKLKKYSTGLIPYKDNLAYLANSKIYLSLTSSDGISLSLVEAMYLGAIPIVSDIEANKELITDGVNGFLVSIDADTLTSKIIEVENLTNEEIMKIQAYNKKLVSEKFDFKKNFENLKKIVEKRMYDNDK